jgi:hypothetical protein
MSYAIDAIERLQIRQRDMERAFEHGQDMGKLRERIRIIKLLQEANSGKTHSASGSCGLCQAIELIKGETK